MSSQIPFSPQLPFPSSHLPLTLISLEDWALITLNGSDNMKFLQSQLTCDIATLDANHFNFGANCNAKGKIISYLYVFHYKKGMAFIERRSVNDNHLRELKKYAIFLKTTITSDDKVILMGVAGFQALETLGEFFDDKVPNMQHPITYHQDTTLLYFNLPTPRILLITNPAIRDTMQDKLAGRAQTNDSQQWLALDIEAGYPVIDSANSAQFIPQAVNIQALNGISFTKGCYIGQEIVARAKYRGANKHALYWLAGKAKHLPAAGDTLELKISKNWRETGTVLAACYLQDSSIWIQAVLNKNLAPNSLLRVCNDNDGALSLRSLPYVISN
ncbi:MAG: tRNA-modifying protein YgfZ [Sodalis sp. (in: enterobacteria)]